MKLTFSSCEARSCCWQSLVTGGQVHTSVLCVKHEWICLGVRREVPPFPRVTGCGFPHLAIKLPDLPSDSSFIPGTRLKGCCISPSPGEQYLGRATLLQSVSTQPYGFFHVHGANGGCEEINGSLHRKLNLAFPQLQVTSSLLRWVSLGTLECICRHWQRGWIYLGKKCVQ